MPQFSPQREHNQGQVLLFTTWAGKNCPFSCGLWFLSNVSFFFSLSFFQIPHWWRASIWHVAWPWSFESLWGFSSNVSLSHYMLVSDPAVGGWLHCLLTKSSGPGAESQKWTDRPSGQQLFLVYEQASFFIFMSSFCYIDRSTSSLVHAGYMTPPNHICELISEQNREDKAKEDIPNADFAGQLSTDAHKQHSTFLFHYTAKWKFWTHNTWIMQGLNSDVNTVPKYAIVLKNMQIQYFLISPPEIWAAGMNVFAPQLWSDQSLHMSGNSVAQKAALSLSDKHQTVWGRGEVQEIFDVENWKAFIKWLSLVKGFILLFFPLHLASLKKSPFLSTLRGVLHCSESSSWDCWHM